MAKIGGLNGFDENEKGKISRWWLAHTTRPWAGDGTENKQKWTSFMTVQVREPKHWWR